MRHAANDDRGRPGAGFTLIEALFALLILGFGVLSAGQLIYLALSSASLARSKGSAALVAQNKLEWLAELYRRNPEAPELSEGTHEGELVQLRGSGTVLNGFAISWQVSPVPDPRGPSTLRAILVRVMVVPARTDGTANLKVRLNKTVNVSSVFCAGVE